MVFGDFIIKSKADLRAAIREFGFLPFFEKSIGGFSIEEHIAPQCWWNSETGAWSAWEWKGPVIRETGCAYGKFFEKKACYISREWFADFANYRRDGYDFDARYDDGLAPYRDKRLYDLIEGNAPILSKQLKQLGNYKKAATRALTPPSRACRRRATSLSAILSTAVTNRERPTAGVWRSIPRRRCLWAAIFPTGSTAVRPKNPTKK